MDESQYTINNPSLFLTVFEQNGTWIAMGTNKAFNFELTASRDWQELTGMGYYQDYPRHTEYMFNGQTSTIATATGTTPLAAMGALLDYLREADEKEKEQNLVYAKRQEDLKRFGGEVDEELIRKVVKWRKKNAAKQAYIDKYEDNDDFDY